MATRAKAIKRMAELGVTIYNEEIDGWGYWEVVLSAPPGYQFVGSQTQDVVLNGCETKAQIWDEALRDMEMGVEPVEEPE